MSIITKVNTCALICGAHFRFRTDSVNAVEFAMASRKDATAAKRLVFRSLPSWPARGGLSPVPSQVGRQAAGINPGPSQNNSAFDGAPLHSCATAARALPAPSIFIHQDGQLGPLLLRKRQCLSERFKQRIADRPEYEAAWAEGREKGRLAFAAQQESDAGVKAKKDAQWEAARAKGVASRLAAEAANPALRAENIAKRLGGITARMADPELRAQWNANVAAANKEKGLLPGFRAAVSEGLKRKYREDPEYALRMIVARQAMRKTRDRSEGEAAVQLDRERLQIPAWVIKAGLETEYHEEMVWRAEHAAASLCRKLKAERAQRG